VASGAEGLPGGPGVVDRGGVGARVVRAEWFCGARARWVGAGRAGECRQGCGAFLAVLQAEKSMTRGTGHCQTPAVMSLTAAMMSWRTSGTGRSPSIRMTKGP